MRFLPLALLAATCGSPEIPEIATDGMEPAVAAAIRSARDAAEADPGDAARWLRLGMVLHAHRLPAPAAIAYAGASRLDEMDHRAPHLHGRMLEAEEPARALALAEEALDRHPGFAPALALRARLLEALGKDATAAWRAVRDAAPRSAEGRLAEARKLLTDGAPGAARDLLQELVDLHPGGAAGWTFLAQALSATGDAEAANRAASRARRATDPYGRDPDPLLLAVEDLRQDRRGREARARRANGETAEALYRRLVAEHPESADLRYNHANALARLGRLPEAETAYREALARDPESSAILANLANLLARAGRNVEADALYRRSLHADPAHVPTLLGASSLQFQRGDLREAERLLRRALAQTPEHPAALQGLGQLLATSGRFAEAAAALTRSLDASASPESRAGIHFLLADVERSRGRRAEALAHLERAEALGMEIPPGFRRRMER